MKKNPFNVWVATSGVLVLVIFVFLLGATANKTVLDWAAYIAFGLFGVLTITYLLSWGYDIGEARANRYHVQKKIEEDSQ